MPAAASAVEAAAMPAKPTRGKAPVLERAPLPAQPRKRHPTALSPAPAAPAVNSGGKFSVARQLGLGVSKIVIDAGHGGHDPGATAFGISESELVWTSHSGSRSFFSSAPGSRRSSPAGPMTT